MKITIGGFNLDRWLLAGFITIAYCCRHVRLCGDVQL